MIELAVTTKAESFERIRGPLLERGIRVTHVDPVGRTVPLSSAASPWTDRSFDVGYVYPSRPMEGAVLDAHLDVPWVNGRDAVLTSRNKAGVLARLDRAGIPTPESVLVSNPVDEAQLVEAFEWIGPPVVVKPNSTTRGVGIARADDLDSFLGITDYLGLVHDFKATGDRSFLVQEYLPDARDYRVMLIDGEYVGAVERRLSETGRKSGRWKHNVHRGAEATGVSISAELRTVAEETAATLEIPVLGVDLLVSGDRIVVNETNARPTIDDAEKYESGFFDRLAACIESRIE